MVLDGFERAATVNPAPARGRRHRVEHIETIDLADVPRFGKLGVIASMHPVGGFFVPQNPPAPAGRRRRLPVGAWAGNIGPERAARGGMWKSISESGGRVVFGQRLAGGDARCDRPDRRHRQPRRRGRAAPISGSRWPAPIDDYTSDAAYASFDEKIKGTLAPGMLADIVVLATDDGFAKAPAVRGDVAVKTTIVDGKVGLPRAVDCATCS